MEGQWYDKLYGVVVLVKIYYIVILETSKVFFKVGRGNISTEINATDAEDKR